MEQDKRHGKKDVKKEYKNRETWYKSYQRRLDERLSNYESNRYRLDDRLVWNTWKFLTIIKLVSTRPKQNKSLMNIVKIIKGQGTTIKVRA